MRSVYARRNPLTGFITPESHGAGGSPRKRRPSPHASWGRPLYLKAPKRKGLLLTWKKSIECG